jgi:ATP-dependent Clp protease ATP-binding subunit ClpA
LVSELEAIRFLIVLDDRYLDDLTDLDKKFAERIRHIRLHDLSRRDLVEIIRNEIGPQAEMAGYSLGDDIIEAALTPAASDEVCAQPGLGIDRVEAAIARARRRKASALSAEDFIPTTARTTTKSAGELNVVLRRTIKGQDQALEAITERLSPALVGLKLRPERPHGVLFFVEPSGSGKTETAKQLASAVYGSADALIRLDMTEYANEEDARMKLIGASSVWKNSSTHGLLTTKVIAQPRSVLLLDEFEKAHPSVWNVFLQVFDEGRLTDGWGNVASFAETIVIMTSNLGVREGSSRAAGFGGKGDFDATRQDAAITEVLPPELLNRITATVRFDALSPEAVREIARMELTRAFERFSQNGWQIEFDENVVEWIARYGYDARFGARHVQRSIETEIFPRVAALQSRQLRVEAEDDSLNVLEL